MNSRINKRCNQLALLALCFGYSWGAATAATEFEQLVVFGDGYSDTGNSYYNSVQLDGVGIPPAPAYFNGRASNGPVWVEYLAEALNLPDLQPAVLGGTNFAWLGAGTSPQSSATGAPDVGTQIQSYLDQGNSPGEKQLIVIWAGLGDFQNSANDVFAVPDPEQLVDNLVGHIESIADAATDGEPVRFLVANLPPLGQTAYSQWLRDSVNPAIPALYDGFATQVNSQLSAQLKLIRKRHDMTIIELDVYEFSADIATDPAAFGFTSGSATARPGKGTDGRPANVTVAELGMIVAPDSFVYYDDIYPTRRWHELLAARAFESIVKASSEGQDN